LRVTDLWNEYEYLNYRLDVKKRLNIPFKREENNLKKLEAALKTNDKRPGVSLPIHEQRIQILDKEYRALEEQYKKVIKRLDKTCPLISGV
jgi:histone acetyltransferase 1